MMHFLKTHFWKLTLLSGAVAVASWLGWGYADQRSTTLVAIDTTTGKLQWVYPLAANSAYTRGPIAGNGKVAIDGCIKTADKNFCGAYQIQTFDAQSGQLLWSDRPSGNYDPYMIASNQATLIQSDRLYLQLENELQALDLTTGAKQWALPRRWFYRQIGSAWYGMGLVARSDKLAMVKIDRLTELLQILDPKTGKLQQIATKIPNLANRTIAANDRTLFLETAGRVPGGSESGTSTVTAYDTKTLQPRFRTDIKSGGIFQMSAIPQSGGFANENILLLDTHSHYDTKTATSSGGGLLAMDADTGQVLWQEKNSLPNCYQRSDYQANIDTVYLSCNPYPERLGRKDTRIVALSLQTGAVKWQTQLSTDSYYPYQRATVTDRQYLTLRKVSQANIRQKQAVALDRQTGKLLWALPLFDDEGPYFTKYGSVVAAESDRFFTLDELPRWQLWLLQLNPNWYLKQPLVN